MSGTVTGGTQDCNNIVGTGGVDCATVTDQTSVSGQYITASSLTRTVSGYTATFTITGKRGASVSYDTTTNLISGGMDWQYLYPSSAAETTCYDLTHTYDSDPLAYYPKVHLYNPGNSTGVTIGIVIATTGISVHDQSFLRRNEKVISNHDQSFMGVWY